MKKLLTFSLFLSLFFMAAIPQVWAQEEGDGLHFGETITEDNAMAFTDFYAQMKNQSEMEVKVRGTVNEVCQAKGCWMTLTDENKELFVKFKDYGFFMPKDISGREVVIEGKAFREVVSVDELKHMAMDAGKSDEEIAKITEPKEELRFMAHGVILVPKGDM